MDNLEDLKPKGFLDVIYEKLNDNDSETLPHVTRCMIEAVEDAIENANSYCIGGRSTVKKDKYNYIFRYSYTKDNKPRKLVIKISNGYYAEGNFTVYHRKGKNDYLNHTDFDTELEYGKSEEYKQWVIPYIVDLSILRGESTTDYVSKVLIYS